MLESEIDVIINSIVRVCKERDIRYLLPPAYKFLTSCYGFRESYNISTFMDDYPYIKLRKTLMDSSIRNQRLNPEKRDIYNSVMMAIKDLPL